MRTSGSASSSASTARSRSRSRAQGRRDRRGRQAVGTATGDTLSTKERPFVLDRPVYPSPTLLVAIEPQTKADLDKMGPALQRMLEEEPTVRVERSATGSSSS